MDSVDAQRMALHQLNLRLEPEMVGYLAEQLASGKALAAISVMGVDARTGVAIRTGAGAAGATQPSADSATAPQ